MSEARPSAPREATQKALREADAHPGHLVPFLTNRSRPVQRYYQEKYPDYEFTWRKGVLYVCRKEAQ